MITLLNIALWVGTILGYIIYNLMRKNEKLEAMVLERDQLITNLTSVIEESNKVISEIDRIGAFKSDDEIGFFFNTVKEIQSTLNKFVSTK